LRAACAIYQDPVTKKKKKRKKETKIEKRVGVKPRKLYENKYEEKKMQKTIEQKSTFSSHFI
jgi:lambda repressor-like predicted transcriptional regulator